MPRSLKQEFDDIRKVGFWVAVLLSLPALGLPTLLDKILDPGRLGVEDTLTLWETFWLTAPLTVSICIVGVTMIRRGRNFWTYETAIAMTAVALIIPLGVSALLDVNVGPRWQEIRPSGGVGGIIIHVLHFYFRLYGLQRFVSAFVVGAFLAWVWGKKLLPHFTK